MVYIVWRALTYRTSDLSKINKFFKKEGWGKVSYKMTITTTGGRTDVLFRWIGHGKEVGKFSIGRFKMGGISWLGDYIANDSSIIPFNTLIKLKALRDLSGDYGAGIG